MQALRMARGMQEALQSTLGRRLAAGITVGVAVFLLFQVARLTLEAWGLCTGCNADGSPDLFGGAAAAGGGAAAGAGDPPGGSWFDDWFDRHFGYHEPPPTIGPANPPPPPDPDQQKADADEAHRLFDIYKHALGLKGLVDMPDGSLGKELNDAMDRFLDFSSGKTDVGPPPPQPVDGGDGDP